MTDQTSLTKKAVFVFDKNDPYSEDEFIDLCETAGFSMAFFIRQIIDYPDKNTYIGKGKVEQLALICREFASINEINLSDLTIACNFELTGLQKKNLEEIIGVNVIDRAFVIFRIFEKNAKTKEAKLQVEIAKLKYLKNQLVDEKASYSQVTSGKGHNKGEGEKKIELTRRIIQDTINYRKIELEEIRSNRKNMRNLRTNSPVPKISVVGYTNAGKSTLMNALLKLCLRTNKKNVLAKDSLFATLETSTRYISCYPFPCFIMTDTVGFVSHLPIQLVESFKSTLEEIKEADLIIHVVDVSSPYMDLQVESTNKVLEDLGVKDIPTIYLFNKYDKRYEISSRLLNNNEMYCSLKDDEDINLILQFISSSLAKNWVKKEIVFPYENDFNEFVSDNYVSKFMQKENGFQCTVYLNPKTLYKYNYLFE